MAAELVPVTFRLMPDSLDSFSAANNFLFSVVATVCVIALFLAILYYLILPEDVRTYVLGDWNFFFNKTK